MNWWLITQPKEEMKHCNNCGAEIDSIDKYYFKCPDCGKSWEYIE